MSSDAVLEILQAFLFGAAMGVVFGVFLKISEFKEKRKNRKLRKKLEKEQK